jgi:hypothetical protein
MACCLALAYLIGLVRAAWFRVRPANAPQRAPFAPPARRAGPSAATAPGDTERAAGPAGHAPGAATALPSPVPPRPSRATEESR